MTVSSENGRCHQAAIAASTATMKMNMSRTKSRQRSARRTTDRDETSTGGDMQHPARRKNTERDYTRALRRDQMLKQIASKGGIEIKRAGKSTRLAAWRLAAILGQWTR